MVMTASAILRARDIPTKPAANLSFKGEPTMSYQTLQVELRDHIAHVRLNRPDKANAMNEAFWHEFRDAMTWVDETPSARVAIISGEGKHFTAGIDLAMLMGLEPDASACAGRERETLRRNILRLQETFTAIERCRVPVLAAIHGACIGGGVDLITACDMRYASSDARFSIKEIDVGMTADVGTLQRLPRLIPEGVARELAYTGREFDAAEARELGLVNRVYPDREALLAGVEEIAAQIAAKSPLSIRGTKEMLLHTRDHSVAEGLERIATWNAAMIVSDDIREALTATLENRPPEFND